MSFLRRMASTWRGRAILVGTVLVVVLLVSGLVSAVREAQDRDSAPSSEISPVTDLLPSLARRPVMRWTVPEGAGTRAPVGGDVERVLYSSAAEPGDGRLEVLRADTGEHLRTISLDGPAEGLTCLVRGAAAACGSEAGVAFVDLAAGAMTGRVATPGAVSGYPVGEGFLLWSAESAPALYRPDGSVKWRAQGTEFVASPGAAVVYVLDRGDGDGDDGVGRVLAADDGRELVQIAVKKGQPVRFQAYPGGFALERPGQQIRFFDAGGEALPGAVSAEGGQRLAAAPGGGGPAPPIPVILEKRRDGVTVVGVDPTQKRNLWKREVAQTDADAVRISGVGTQVVVDDGAGRCFAFAAASGDGGAIGCESVLGADSERVATVGVAAWQPGAAQPLWTQELADAKAFGGGLYGAAGRLL
ncbi:hypothetical protein [Gordonia caeni]|uniref:hypothetical protein n=1 Tax=Gordonia caeni TaxID=1007097 RepID=UPI0031DB7008